MKKRLIVIALGGNALIKRGEEGTYEEQLGNLRRIAHFLIRLAKEYKVILTHGNGPQVGALCIQQEMCKSEVPAQPLHVCVAMTQAQIGYMIQQALNSVNPDLRVSVVITRVLVSPEDPAFRRPTKPIGPYYTLERAKRLEKERGWFFVEVPGRGYRRVVPSPKPLRIIDLDVIKHMLDCCDVVVAGGGGGIPVVVRGGVYEGVDAVIDKDATSSLLAEELGAEKLVIVTDVEGVYLNYGSPEQVLLREVSVKDMKRYMSEGHFPPGSMGPKVEAAVRFVERTGKTAVIGLLERLEEVVEGRGTVIKPC